MVAAIGTGRAFEQRLGKLIEDEIHHVVQDFLYGTEFEFIPKGQLTDLHGKFGFRERPAPRLSVLPLTS